MLTILQVVPDLAAGGAERTTIEVADAVVRAGGRALVASRGGRLEGELAAVGGELIRMDAATKSPVQIWANAGRLARIAAREGVAIIHARSRAPGWSALWAARRARVGFVTTYHGIYNARSPLKRWYNSVMAQGDMVIANSHYTARHVRAAHATPGERLQVIYRGVDLARFDPTRLDPGRVGAVEARWGVLGDARARVLLPARLTRWKGQELLIDAAQRLQARGLSPVYILAGDAQGRDAYAAGLTLRALRAGLGDLVRIVGHAEDMPGALAAADLVVTPSLEPEAFGRAGAEAQAMGRITIGPDHGATPEVIADGETGFLFPPGDADGLAAAIARALAIDAATRTGMQNAARSRAVAMFSAETLKQATLDVYARVVEARG